MTNTAINTTQDWKDQHENYVAEHIKLDQDEDTIPWTFRQENANNWLRQVSPEIHLIRVELAQDLCDAMDCTTETLREYLLKYRTGNSKQKSESNLWLSKLVEQWNKERDKRPSFVTTELEVDDILPAPEDDGAGDWAEQLRDRLGLGHRSPTPGGPPVEIIVLRYTVGEVLATLQTYDAYPAVPTVLDSEMSHYFFPSPIPGPGADSNPHYGHTLNLSPIESENNYQMGVELLHPYLPYEPHHLYKVGVIARPFQQDLAQARSFHLPWLRLYKGREDFGA